MVWLHSQHDMLASIIVCYINTCELLLLLLLLLNILAGFMRQFSKINYKLLSMLVLCINIKFIKLKFNYVYL